MEKRNQAPEKDQNIKKQSKISVRRVHLTRDLKHDVTELLELSSAR
jgi:hypothetical protein